MHPCYPQNDSILLEELILQILLRLPVRSLLQFRCVCKSWKTLISDPCFAKNHLQYSTDESNMTHLRLVSFVGREQPYKILSYLVKSLFENPSIPVEPDSFSIRNKYTIIDSCNGLLCLFYWSLNCVRLCNPSTRLKSKKSPTAIKNGLEDLYITYYGFGYDKVNDKYKFLAVLSDGNGIRIYTFGEDSWTTAQDFPRNPRRLRGKYVSGTLNWLADDGSLTFVQSVILSFDLEKETFREVLLPQNDVHNMCTPHLYVLNNCLCVFFKTSETSWEAWLMKEYGVVESWTKFMAIPHPWPDFVDPLIISEDGAVLLVNAVTHIISLYNFISGDGSSDYDYPLISTKLGYDQHICRESLISPYL